MEQNTSNATLTTTQLELQQFEYLVQRFGRLPAYMTNSPIDNRSWELTSVIYTFGSLALLSVMLRFYVRIRYFGVRAVGWDDACIVAAVLSACAFSGVYIWGVLKGGVGRFDIDVEIGMFPVLLQTMFVSQIIYHPAVAFMKASICLYLLRIATHKIYRVIIWSTLIASTVYMLIAMCVTASQCNYLKLFYHQDVGKICLLPATIEKWGYATSGFNIFTDFVLVILPIPMLWNVQISRRKKTTIVGILSLGAFASIATIVRLMYIILQAPSVDAARRIDYVIWTVIELNTGIFVANIPAFAPLIRDLKRRKGSISSTDKIGSTSSRFGLRPFKLSRSVESDLTDMSFNDDLEKEAGIYDADFKDEDWRKMGTSPVPPKEGIRKTMTIHVHGAKVEGGQF